VGPRTRGLRAEGPRKQERQRSSFLEAEKQKIADALADLAGVPANAMEYRGHGQEARATGESEPPPHFAAAWRGVVRTI